MRPTGPGFQLRLDERAYVSVQVRYGKCRRRAGCGSAWPPAGRHVVALDGRSSSARCCPTRHAPGAGNTPAVNARGLGDDVAGSVPPCPTLMCSAVLVAYPAVTAVHDSLDVVDVRPGHREERLPVLDVHVRNAARRRAPTLVISGSDGERRVLHAQLARLLDPPSPGSGWLRLRATTARRHHRGGARPCATRWATCAR